MATINLLYKDQYPINDKISVRIPKVGEILEDEDGYYGLVSILTAMPIDMMVQLDDIGVDFTKINEYELFLLYFKALGAMDTALVFGNMDLERFAPAINEDNGMIVLLDAENDIVIDRNIHAQIADALRAIHRMKKDVRKPFNAETKDYMIERARKKQKRRQKQKQKSQLESLIVALVNAGEFKYDYESVKELTIYQFNESVQQIVQKVNYDNTMRGVYAGTVDPKKLSQDDLTWLKHK